MSQITGILNDFALMTEGEHSGRYGARIDDKPYPVMQHVDVFLVKLQKNVPVDVTLNKDGWISKIQPAKKSPLPAKKEQTREEIAKEQTEYNARSAAIEETARKNREHLAEIEKQKKRESDEMTAKLVEDERKLAALKKAGFEVPAKVQPYKMDADAPKDEKGQSGFSKVQSPIIDAEMPLPKPATQIATVHPSSPAIRYNEDQLTLMRAKVAPNCTQTEFELLMYIANKYNLDPLIRQIWAIKYEGKPALIFAGRDGFLEIAHRSGHFDGMKSDCVYDDKGVLVSVWCEIWRNDMTHSFRSSVLLSEYTTGMNLWKSKPSVMLIKCAESVCLRKAFSVSGLYAPEEVGE